MTEQDFVEKFVADLVSVYGYPKETIKRNVQIDIHRYDVLIQKGTVYIQAFEFKKKPIQGIRFIYQRFSEVSVDTPFYRVIFKDDGSWTIYEGDDFKDPIQNVKEVLNYKKAIAKFFQDAQHDVGRVIKWLKIKCRICACVLALYFACYVFYCCICCCGNDYAPNLLSYDIILYLCLIIILVLLPSLIQLIGVVRRVKIGLFELELADKLDI